VNKKNKPENFQAAFLPWAGIKKEITIGEISFWPFNPETSKRITNKDVVNYLKKYFDSYLDHSGSAVLPTIVSFKDRYEFHHTSEAEYKIIRSAVDILIFSIISTGTLSSVVSNNNHYGPPSADRYQLIIQDFNPQSTTVSISAGTVLSGGWRIGEVKFPMPWHVGGFNDSLNEEFLATLALVMSTEVKDSFRTRLFRSFEWFRFAHTESDFISVLTKVVLMSTAFEVLLQVPKTGNKKGFIRDEIENRCAKPNSIRETKISRKGEQFIYSKAAWWSWDFYDLRNAIVHGDEVIIDKILYSVSGREWLTHLIVADLVFYECVIYELTENNCVSPKLTKIVEALRELRPEEPIEVLNRNGSNLLYSFNELHMKLGWHLEQRKKRE
jgi:hypothetical protein